MMIKKSPSQLPIAIFLVGPTASGKTSLAIKLSKKLPIDIISVDSGLIYKGMDIGTAKPCANLLSKFKHRLINICDPSESYSSVNFYYDAINEMKNIVLSGKIPLLVGGTMLFFKVLLNGLFLLPPVNVEIRNLLINQANKLGWRLLYNELAKLDPVSASRIHNNDKNRLLRALEVYLVTGKTLSQLQNNPDKTLLLSYKIYQFAIIPDNKKLLNNRIKNRFLQMLNDGFEDEVYMFFTRGDLNKNMPSMKCVGYRQMWSYLAGEINYEKMISQSISATKKLAKHQITWLKNWKNIFWLDSNKQTDAINKILKILS